MKAILAAGLVAFETKNLSCECRHCIVVENVLLLEPGNLGKTVLVLTAIN